ncbi:MAG: GAF domain-containing protein [Betaproteobacteria bacterium]|nr:GAF domain-containing protein [Betaproteobacteria bacterium]
MALTERIRVLMVEDIATDAEMELRELRRSGMSVESRVVDTEDGFRRALADFGPHVILSDFSMPDFDGMTALAIARETSPDIPFIFVSGTIGEEYAIRALRNGATDYVLKNNLVRLPVAVERAIQEARERTARREQEQKIAHLSRIRAMLSGFNSAIIRVKHSQELFQEACAIAVEHGRFAVAWIGTLDRATLDVTPVAWAGIDAEPLARMAATARGDVPEGQGVMGRAIREKRPVFSNDIAAEQRSGEARQQEALRRGYRSLIALPLVVADTVAGNLSLYAWEPDFFDEEEVTLLTELASDVAFAMEYIGVQRELQEERQLLHNLMDSVPEAIFFKDTEHRYVRLNRAHAERLGLNDPNEVIGKTTHYHQSREFALERDAEEKELFASGVPMVDRVARAQTKSGEVHWYSTTKAPIKDRQGNIVGLVGISRDVTDQKRAEDRIRRLNRVYAVLSGINTLIVHARDRQKLFEESCRIAVEEGQFPFAWIGVLDPATQDVNAVARAGKHAETLTWAKSSARDDTQRGRGAVGRAIRERRPVINNNIAASGSGGPRREEILKLGFQSIIALPLFEDQTVIGTLTMYARESDFFDQEELKLLEELAGDISFAVETIAKQQKFEKLSRIRAVSSEINTAIVRIRDREALLRETCRIAVEAGKFQMVWVAALDPVKREVRPIAWDGFSAATALAVNWTAISSPGVMLGEVIQTRRLVVRNDIEAGSPVGLLRQEALRRGCRSTVCLPFLIGDTVVAAAILFAAGKGFFDEEEVALLNEVAGNISFALEHIEKEEKIARLSRIQAVMSNINALIVRVRDRSELFDGACRIAVEHGGFGIAWIGTFDPQTLEVAPVAHAGLQAGDVLVNFKSSASIEHPLGRGVVGRAIRERMPAFVDDLTKEPGAGERRREAVRRGYHSRIALPLLVDNGVVAVMVLFATERNYFNQDEVKLLTELASDISFALEHIGKEEKLNYLAYYDALTGLPNRTLLEERLGRQLHLAREKKTKVALLLGNVNRFRFINESLGRHAGDALLREFAARAKKVWPDPEHVARISADSFGGIVADVNDETEIAHLPGQLVTEVVRLPFKIGDKDLAITMAAGIAVFPADGADADALFRNAEAALKQAKSSGEHFLFYRPEMNARVAETLQLENKLRQALDKEEFVLHYQPKLDLAKGTICGVEALIRWNDPETGLVPPIKFIPLLEETGMILEAGGWAMRKAVADYRSWCAQGLQPPRIAVNVSPIQLRQKDFVDVVCEAIGGSGAETHGLDLEITESLIMEDIEGNIEKLRAVRDMGVNIAIDDFGTGYSSLRYLAKLPVNAVKIDRSFIITMVNDPDSMTIVSTIISLAHSLNLKVVAEGVDAEEQRRFLKLLRCDEMQGYLFSRPVPKNELLALLQVDSTVPGS